MSAVASKRKGGKYAGQGYDAVRSIAALPFKSRRALAIGRGGAKIKPRKFHLGVDELDQLREEYKTTNVIPNPFNKGSYHFIVAALIGLGVNKSHKYSDFQTAVRLAMSAKETRKGEGDNVTTAWERFRDKDARNENTGLDVYDRLEQNVRVLQRFGGMTPYGLKLNEVGQRVCRFKGLVIDLLKDGEGNTLIRLNTDANRPTNELKTRNVAPVKPVRKAKRKTAPKAAPATAPATTEVTGDTTPASDAAQSSDTANVG